jgi:ETC complex I subunit conserved region
MKARIYSPCRSAMQSGLAKSNYWQLDYISTTPRCPEPLMGWTSAGDTLGQLQLRFPTLEDAISYAEKHQLAYEVEERHERRPRPNNYTMNFRPTLRR